MRRLVFAEPAERDLDGIIDYIALDNPAAAEKVYRAIVAAAERLRDFPEMGRAGRLPDTRELLVSALPYLIVYEVGTGSVTILAVFHNLPRSGSDAGRARVRAEALKDTAAR